MPKDKSSSSLSNKSRDLFYKPYSTSPRGASPQQRDEKQQQQQQEEDAAAAAEWKDLTCPICMESPHNAVLLLCSSSDKGCRPYLCDTSYRHANCLDQYLKAHAKTQAPGGAVSVRTVLASGAETRPPPPPGGRPLDISGHSVECYKTCKGLELVCPLCRGKVNGWKVVDKARQQLNFKRRGCAHDSCSYVGAYDQLRKHARYVHPFARPSEVDPARQREWWRLESQRDLGDVFSSIQSAMPGATIVGDYVIEDGDEEDEERDEEPFDVEHGRDEEDEDEDDEELRGEMVPGSGAAGSAGGSGAGVAGGASAGVDRSLWTMLFLFRVFGGSSSSRHHHHTSGSSSSSHHQSHRSHEQHHHRRGSGGGGSSSSGNSYYQQRRQHERRLAALPRSYRAPSPFRRTRGSGSASSSGSSSRAGMMDRNRTPPSSSSSSRNRRRSHG